MVPIEPGGAASPVSPPMLLEIDPRSAVPLQRQIYDALRRAILEGRIRPGQRLPASRAMAAELGLSRNTVLAAYDQLLSEGYLSGRPGSGTFVSDALPEHLLQTASSGKRPARAPAGGRRISQRARAMAGVNVTAPHVTSEIVPFQTRGPALDEFPFELWSRIVTRHIRTLSRQSFSYGDPAGYAPLREAIAAYLRTARAVRCDAAQVIIVSGAQQAIDLATKVLVDPGEKVLVEDPGYLGTRGALRAAGVETVPVPVDDEGIAIDVGARRAPEARMVCVTPSHQFPLGVTMSLARRLRLLDWAAASGAWIFEDDYDAEYRYGGRPVPSLQGLDGEERVIYVGTFSKVLFPGLRLGYMVVPEDLVPHFVAARSIADRHGPILESAVVATFIEEGHFARHVRRMRVLYQERQRALVAAVRKELAGTMEIAPSEAGMHLIGWLPESWDDREAAARCAREGAVVIPLSGYVMREKLPPGLVLGYTPFNERKLRRGVRALGRALR